MAINNKNIFHFRFQCIHIESVIYFRCLLLFVFFFLHIYFSVCDCVLLFSLHSLLSVDVVPNTQTSTTTSMATAIICKLQQQQQHQGFPPTAFITSPTQRCNQIQQQQQRTPLIIIIGNNSIRFGISPMSECTTY